MPKTKTKAAAVLRLARHGPIRARDLAPAGIPRSYLARLVTQGLLEQVDRGLYRRIDAATTEQQTLADVAKRVPHATICLLSALQFHGLTTEAPSAVWLLIDRHARAPAFVQPQVVIVRASGLAKDHGVEIHRLDGVRVHVTSPAKTVADCFRFRRHVGLEVALTALRDYVRLHRGGIDALVTAARADRVYSVLRPYLEAVV